MAKNFLRIVIGNFRTKYRISFRRPHDNKEEWYIFVSPLRLMLAFFSLATILFTLGVLLITYTPMLDMIPGYPGGRSRDILLANVQKLDSIERQIELWNKYQENITLIMDGKSPMPVGEDSHNDSISENIPLATASHEDSIFRAHSQELLAAKDPDLTRERAKYELYTPVQGVVTKSFDITSGEYGVRVSAATQSEVVSASDGVIVLESWSPQDGNVIAIQHGGNLISVYKNLARVLKHRGDVVMGGEVIGYTGGDDQTNSDKEEVVIEVWDSGSATDPQKYMLF